MTPKPTDNENASPSNQVTAAELANRLDRTQPRTRGPWSKCLAGALRLTIAAAVPVGVVVATDSVAHAQVATGYGDGFNAGYGYATDAYALDYAWADVVAYGAYYAGMLGEEFAAGWSAGAQAGWGDACANAGDTSGEGCPGACGCSCASSCGCGCS